MPPRKRTTPAPSTGKISLDFDPEQLTLGELEDFADAAGMEFNEATTTVEVGGKQVRRMKARGLVALVWILERRKNPAYTMDEARQVKIRSLDMPAAAKKAANPTRPGN